jgi:VanZ family protein
MSRRTQLITWVPVVIVMALIFIASAQPKHAPAPDQGRVYFSGMIPIFAGGWDALIKKSAHMIAYGALAVLILRALLAHGLSSREATAVAVLLTVAYALTDELHQAFVMGRSSSVLDIGFDYVGAAASCLLARHLPVRQNKTSPPAQGDRSP